MSLFSEIARFFREMPQPARMAKVDNVAAKMPPDAQYVSVGPVMVLGDAEGFIHRGPSLFVRLGYVPRAFWKAADAEGQQICYLVLAGSNLLIIRENGPMVTVPVGDIVRMQQYLEGGFVLVLKDGRGIACAKHTPVEVPPQATFRTVTSPTSNQSGWEKELAVFGVPMAIRQTDKTGSNQA